VGEEDGGQSLIHTGLHLTTLEHPTYHPCNRISSPLTKHIVASIQRSKSIQAVVYVTDILIREFLRLLGF
jgi:hypothetical protein